jgi:Peptidase family M48
MALILTYSDTLAKCQCTEVIYCDLVTYDLHRKTFIKAAEVGIVQHQTNLRCSGGREAILETVRTTVQFVIPASKHWNGDRLANIPTAAVPMHTRNRHWHAERPTNSPTSVHRPCQWHTKPSSATSKLPPGVQRGLRLAPGVQIGLRILRRVVCCLISFSGCLILTSGILQAQDRPLQQQAESLQKMFEQMAANAGPMAPLFGRLTPEQMAKLDAVNVTPAEESKFGQRILDAYLQQLKDQKIAVTQHGKDIEYLRQLVNLIKPLMTHGARYRQIDIRMIERDEMDAYSIPGGRLLLTRGMIEKSGSEATLVGVLGHELGHQDRGHQLIPLKQSKLSNQPLDFKDRMMWLSLVARPFRPEQETEADEDATRWMMALGYDAKELAKLLVRWDQEQDQTVPWMQFVPGFVKSHPDAGRRAERVLQSAQRLAPTYPNAQYIGVDNLEQRSPWKRKVP